MKSLFFLGVVLITLFSCNSNTEKRVVKMDSFFHDNSSKVWMIQSVSKGNEDFTPKNMNFRDVIIFYDNGKFIVQPLNSLGNREGIKGTFEINSEQKRVNLIFEKEIDQYDFKFESEKKLNLNPTKKSTHQYKLVLIPLPEI